MAVYEINQLQHFFPNSELVSAKISKLTSAGDNYGGALLSVDVTIKEEQEKQVRLVAKVLPRNEYIQKMFNSQRTFRNEVGFYQTITPCLKQFQKEQGLCDTFATVPTFHGARFSLDPSSTKIDEDGVLLLENLKSEGFHTIDRTVGFDLEQSHLILRKLAELHGTAYALKKLKPDVFNKEMGPFFEEYTIFDVGSEAGIPMMQAVLNLLKDDDVCTKNMAKIEDALHKNAAVIVRRNRKDMNGGLFDGLAHGDMWINNIMLKIVDGKTTDVKFIDFQLYDYSSLTQDVVFFLFTSVELSVLKQHCDKLIALYYNAFIQFVTKLKCDVTLLTFESFLAEMESAVKNTEFFHVMLMLRTIYALDEYTREVEDVKQEDFYHFDMGKACEEKACYIVREFLKRGWL